MKIFFAIIFSFLIFLNYISCTDYYKVLELTKDATL